MNRMEENALHWIDVDDIKLTPAEPQRRNGCDSALKRIGRKILSCNAMVRMESKTERSVPATRRRIIMRAALNSMLSAVSHAVTVRG